MKVFNPKRCPYAQLLEYKGAAIIFVESLDDMYRDEQSLYWARVRLLSGGDMKYSWGYPKEFSRSCFWRRGRTHEENILNMLRHDIKERLEIVFVEFCE